MIYRILVVEDEDDVREIARSALKGAGDDGGPSGTFATKSARSCASNCRT
jgi:CheY-like chemotaxis protein